MENIKYKKRHLKTVSLFSGAGGLDLGFQNAGFDVIWANDINKYAAESYKANIGDHIVCGDLNEHLDKIPEHDVLIGGFPCQPFSMMGEQKGFDDDRGTLFFTIQQILEKHNTKIVVLENVRNLLNHDGGKTFQKIKNILEEKLGYKIFYKIINTSDYGIPQTRRRVFLVCFKKEFYPDLEFEFPKEIEMKTTLQNILDKEVDQKYFLSEKILETVLAHGTKNYRAKSEIDLKVARPLTATMHKMHRASQDNYVTDKENRCKFENTEKLISDVRRLTPNECRKLQGFPNTWKKVVSDTQEYVQFGNAVTVDTAYHIAKEVVNSLKINLDEYFENSLQKEKFFYLKKSEYSLFKSLSDVETSKDKKEYKEIITNMKNSICEIYKIERTIKNSKILNDEILDKFLYDIGILQTQEDFQKLKSLLGKDFNNFISVISIFLSLELKKTEYDINILKYMDFYRKSELELALKSTSPTVVDLFCGAGGLSTGFFQKGFRSILANDIEDACIETYSFNHLDIPKSRAIAGDIKIICENIHNLVRENTDIVVGGPPCQSFSMANRQRVIDDPRNILYTYYVKVVEKLKPKFFVMENVKGMLEAAEQVVEDFHNLESVNYSVAYKVFNAKDFSVPQNRERLIYIGVRSDIDITPQQVIEEITEYSKQCPKFILGDALSDLRELKPFTTKNATEFDTEESGKKIDGKKISNLSSGDYVKLVNQNREPSLIFNHKTRFNNSRDIEIFGRMLPGDKSDSPRIADIMPYKSREHIFKDKYYKLKMDDICKTITAHMKFDCNMYIHPNQARGLTPREAARIQSYPDDYMFLGPYTKTYMQVGNSVPPLMSRAFATIIKKYL